MPFISCLVSKLATGGHICCFTPILRVNPTVDFVHPQTVLQISIYLFSRAI